MMMRWRAISRARHVIWRLTGVECIYSVGALCLGGEDATYDGDGPDYELAGKSRRGAVWTGAGTWTRSHPPAGGQEGERAVPQLPPHACEDVLVAFVLDCVRCGRRFHWVPGEGCTLGHWAHSEPAPDNHRPRLRS
jgi:hypothetical protein